jgi:hypothetical protein
MRNITYLQFVELFAEPFLGTMKTFAYTVCISVADPDPGSGIRCLFDPWIPDPGS